MIRSNLFFIFVIYLFSLSGNSYAVEFEECKKFLNKDQYKHKDCLNYSFSEALAKSEYEKISIRLNNHIEKNKYQYSDYLTILMCGNHANMVEGDRPFKTKDRKHIIKLTDLLLKSGASFKSMPSFSIVTPLFCVSNRGDSVILEHILQRIKVTKETLNSVHYEGSSPAHIPLNRAIINNDLESAKFLLNTDLRQNLVQCLIAPPLKIALKNGNIKIANWLLDIGASVHKKDEQKGCSGKSVLNYAMEIPESTKGRKEIVSRIKKLMLLPSSFKENCNITNA